MATTITVVSRAQRLVQRYFLLAFLLTESGRILEERSKEPLTGVHAAGVVLAPPSQLQALENKASRHYVLRQRPGNFQDGWVWVMELLLAGI